MPNSVFVAVGHNGIRLQSEDGRNWQNAQTGREGEVYRTACFGNGQLLAVGSYGGNNIFAATRDGQNWRTANQDARYSRYIRGLVFGNNQFLGFGGNPGNSNDASPFVLTSQDGISWSSPHDISGRYIIRRAVFGNDKFVGVGDRGRRSVSNDGRSWRNAENTRALDTLIDVAFGNGIFVGTGLHGLRMATTDGLEWTEPLRGEEGEHLNSILWARDRFVAVGLGVTYTSRDGRTWERHPNRNAPTTATYGNGIFVGSRWRGRLLRSTDGIEWEQVYDGEHHFEAVAFGDFTS